MPFLPSSCILLAVKRGLASYNNDWCHIFQPQLTFHLWHHFSGSTEVEWNVIKGMGLNFWASVRLYAFSYFGLWRGEYKSDYNNYFLLRCLIEFCQFKIWLWKLIGLFGGYLDREVFIAEIVYVRSIAYILNLVISQWSS